MAALLPLRTEEQAYWEALVSAAVAVTPSSVYLWFTGDTSPRTATAGLLEQFGTLLRPVAYDNPRLNVVPLLPFATWSADHVANIPDLDSILVSSAEDAQLFERLQGSRAAQLPCLKRVQLPDEPTRTAAGQTQEDRADKPGASVGASGASSQAPLAFEHVAVGGTFDRLHVGHRLLLAATALVATQRVYVGVTGDQLLAKKSHRELLEPYEDRAAAAEGYLKAVRPGLTVQTGALLDPKEPTAAATEAAMQALVVSKETIPGAEAIQQYRKEHGYPPLVVIVVDVIADTRAVADGKVSSTALREQDAQRLQQRAAAT